MGYLDTKNKIISTLTGRVLGHQILPSEHQEFALALLEYTRSVELISGSTLIGIAEHNTAPVQPDTANVCYISSCPINGTITFSNFHDDSGQPITYTSQTNSATFIILLWNRAYWSIKTIPIGVTNPMHDPVSETEFERMVAAGEIENGVYYPTYEDE